MSNTPSYRRCGNAAATPDELHTVMHLYHSGVSKAAIARQTGFSGASIYGIIRRFTVGGRKLPPASNYAPPLVPERTVEPLRDVTTRYSVFETEYDRVVAILRAAAPGVTGTVSITVQVPF